MYQAGKRPKNNDTKIVTVSKLNVLMLELKKRYFFSLITWKESMLP